MVSLKSVFLAIAWACVCSQAMAANGHFVVLAGGGVTEAKATGHLTVTSTETDTLHQTNRRTAGTGFIGAGYALTPANASRYLQEILFALTLYNTSYTARGDVWLFGEPALNDFRYALPVRSTRLMVDGRWYFPAWHQISPYVLGGLGAAWNRASYQDVPVMNMPGAITLRQGNNLRFAAEAGVGVQYAFNPGVAVFAQYLYSDAGHANPLSRDNGIALSSVSVRGSAGLAGVVLTFGA